MGFPIQTLIVQKAKKSKHKAGPLDAPVSLVNVDGTAFTGVAPTNANLTVDANGKVTGGSITLSDGTAIPVTLAQAGAQSEEEPNQGSGKDEKKTGK